MWEKAPAHFNRQGLRPALMIKLQLLLQLLASSNSAPSEPACSRPSSQSSEQEEEAAAHLDAVLKMMIAEQAASVAVEEHRVEKD